MLERGKIDVKGRWRDKKLAFGEVGDVCGLHFDGLLLSVGVSQ